MENDLHEQWIKDLCPGHGIEVEGVKGVKESGFPRIVEKVRSNMCATNRQPRYEHQAFLRRRCGVYQEQALRHYIRTN